MHHLIVDLETAPIEDAATYVEAVSAPSNYKDPEKIAAYVAEKQCEQVGKCALDPDLCRIVAIGVAPSDCDFQPSVHICQTESQEESALRWLWGQVKSQTVLVGFNLLAFDIKILLRRSLYLHIKAPDIQVDRFKHPQIDDLMLRLAFNDPKKAHSLSFYTQRFGLPAVDDDVTGADIGDLVTAGDWDAVANHCKGDVLRTLHLAQRLQVVPIPTEVTVF
jgi:predicted PolB exonuclease-like 3'-5' exonuclease